MTHLLGDSDAVPDVCFILEGTYPFVAGGVSSWVHHLITQMPELTFGIVHLSPRSGFYTGALAYELPENVIRLEEAPLQRPPEKKWRLRSPVSKKAVEVFWQFAEQIRGDRSETFAEFVANMRRVSEGSTPSAWDFLLTRASWRVLQACYREEAVGESFLNFFWTWHFAYQPLLNVLAYPMPRSGMYHTVSTGYAGILAAAARLGHDRPMILTEHGIYTKERRIEIHSAEWIPESNGNSVLVDSTAPYFKRFWNRHFQVMSRICYEHADEIFTLYHGNTLSQICDGADTAKIRVIPNGINLDRMQDAARRHDERAENERFTVGFVGRVCPIKDVRTFIAAMRLVAKEVPNMLARILGPMDEDQEYADDCKNFSRELGLDDNVRFEGRVDVAQEMPSLDVLVLTSISEAQPLVVLEGGAVGIPSITTDVGCCKDLLEGSSPDDRQLGIGGLVTPIATPGATAAAVLKLFHDPEGRRKMGLVLRERVRRYYAQSAMVGAYRAIYERNLALEVR